MMRSISIFLGMVPVLVLLYSGQIFAEDESLGAKGLLSTRDMRAITKSGGTFTSQGNVLSGGTQVRYGGDEKSRSAAITDANVINQLNTKGQATVMNKGGGTTTIVSGGEISKPLNAAMYNSQNNGKTGDADYGLGRGSSAAMGSAVGVLEAKYGTSAAAPTATSINAPVLKEWSGPQTPNQRGSEKDAADQVWRAQGYPKVDNWRQLLGSTNTATTDSAVTVEKVQVISTPFTSNNKSPGITPSGIKRTDNGSLTVSLQD
jgi:hypothetical protein